MNPGQNEKSTLYSLVPPLFFLRHLKICRLRSGGALSVLYGMYGALGRIIDHVTLSFILSINGRHDIMKTISTANINISTTLL